MILYDKKISCFSSLSWLKVFCGLAFVVSLFFVVIYFQRYIAARQWHKAHELLTTPACSHPASTHPGALRHPSQEGNRRGIKFVEAENIYSNIYPKLKWNGRFLSYYGSVLLQNEKYSEAIELFEKAKFTYPDPYLFENLGVAYVSLANGGEIPLNPLRHKTSPGECINKAINYWELSSNILPWRWTPKYYLADLFYQLGDTNNTIKYARLVVNTPMKKWTDRGKEFKLKSQKMLIALGACPETREVTCSWKKCDDPGLIVFDIHDKKTWNEGKW